MEHNHGHENSNEIKARRDHLHAITILLDVDSRSRWRIILVSAATTALFGFLGETIGHPVRNILVWATTVGQLILVGQILVYVVSFTWCQRHQRPTNKVTKLPTKKTNADREPQ